MTIKSIARNTLFDQRQTKHNLLWAMTTDTLKVMSAVITGNERIEFTTHKALGEFSFNVIPNVSHYLDVLLNREVLPLSFPKKLFQTIDKALLELGKANEKGQRHFYIKKSKCYQNDGFYTLEVGYADTVKVDALHTFEATIEDKIAKLGYGNIRINHKPLRIEVDKTETMKVTLKQYWEKLNKYKMDNLLAIPAVEFTNKGMRLFEMKLFNQEFSTLIAGIPGSGKTQLALALILSLSRLNNPKKLKMYLVDPKVLDFMPLNDLPHLARPIINDANEALEVTRIILAELDERKERAKKKDYSFLQESIFLYVDELADVYEQLQGKEKEEFVSNIQRLALIGRGLGLILVCATQRVYDLEKRMYANLFNRFALKSRDANDSFATTSEKGTTVHKLPGKGACELYPKGIRLQGLFVADPNDEDYIETLEWFVQSIKAVHSGNAPQEDSDSADDVLVVSEQALEAFEESEFDTQFLLAVYEEMVDGEISERKISEIHKELIGTELRSEKRKTVKNLVNSVIPQ